MFGTKDVIKQSDVLEKGFSIPIIHDKSKETKPEKLPENSKKNNNGK